VASTALLRFSISLGLPDLMFTETGISEKCDELLNILGEKCDKRREGKER